MYYNTINKELVYDDLHTFLMYAFMDSHARTKESRTNSSQWAGGLTWEEAKQMALNGWREGMLEIEKYRVKIFDNLAQKIVRTEPEYSVRGHNVDVGRFLANDPECLINRTFNEKNGPGKIYKIVCSISFSAAIRPETIIQRGAMICALIDALEYSGNRTEVICNDACSSHDSQIHRAGNRKEDGWFEVSVTLKKASQPLDLSTMAFCLAHPVMLRKIMFSIAELEGWSDFAYCYGYPAKATDKGDLYIEEIYSGTVSDDQAKEWVLGELLRFGISVEGC